MRIRHIYSMYTGYMCGVTTGSIGYLDPKKKKQWNCRECAEKSMDDTVLRKFKFYDYKEEIQAISRKVLFERDFKKILK